MSQSSDYSASLSSEHDVTSAATETQIFNIPTSDIVTGHEPVLLQPIDETQGRSASLSQSAASRPTYHRDSRLMSDPSPKPTRKHFKDHPELKTQSLTRMSNIVPRSPLQDQLNRNLHKAGLCVICSCTNPKYGDPIIKCTAPERMSECFGSKLGYSVIKVDSGLSRKTLEKLLCDLSQLEIPESLDKDNFRFLFYFFGHGTENEVCLADGNFKRSCIIEELQKVDRDMFKIALLDSCRTAESSEGATPGLEMMQPYRYNLEVNMDAPIQETIVSLAGKSQWVDYKERYPYAKCVNTLVINATNFKSKAYYMDSDLYPEIKGCGLVTHFFTQLAPELNQPIMAVLAEVRKAVAEFIKKSQKSPIHSQVLVYEDLLMGNVNLLAESKGTVRVKPVIVPPLQVSILSTIIQWVFRLNIDERISEFKVICRDEDGNIMNIQEEIILKNVAEFKNDSLEPKTTYYVKVVAVYKDTFRSESEDEFSFTTPERSAPCDITTTQAPNEPLKVMWKFDGGDSNLSGFLVDVGSDEKQINPIQICACNREAVIKGLKLNNITVIALYRDGRRTQCHVRV